MVREKKKDGRRGKGSTSIHRQGIQNSALSFIEHLQILRDGAKAPCAGKKHTRPTVSIAPHTCTEFQCSLLAPGTKQHQAASTDSPNFLKHCAKVQRGFVPKFQPDLAKD